ncbi:MAG: hypothetical protein V2A61_00395 [Calditrichota bacterium]
MPTFTISSKKPVVVLDVDEYEAIQDRLERLEFLESRTLKKDIIDARQALREGRTVPLAKLKAKLLEN